MTAVPRAVARAHLSKVVDDAARTRERTHSLPEAVAAACANFLHDVLADRPHRVGKPLRDELAGRHSARRGEFRVIEESHDELAVVRVVSTRHLPEAYS
ncbi:MAG: type II toxin-antitoxin system RelE family toxin [Nocardioides sp.]